MNRETSKFWRPRTAIDAKCQQIRRNWSETERKLRELPASVAAKQTCALACLPGPEARTLDTLLGR